MKRAVMIHDDQTIEVYIGRNRVKLEVVTNTRDLVRKLHEVELILFNKGYKVIYKELKAVA